MSEAGLSARADWLLRIDSLGGIFVGVGVLALSPWLDGLFGFPMNLVLFLGAANVIYGCFSGSLLLLSYRQGPPGRAWFLFLIVANVAWLAVCVGVVYYYGAGATWLGLAHVMLEGLYVAGLGLYEYRVLSSEKWWT